MALKRKLTIQEMPRDARTGKLIPVGYGSLKGRFMTRKGIDLTKPIYDQVVDGSTPSLPACKAGNS